MLVALFMAAVPTRAQDAGDDLGELTIAVVSSNGGAAPRPTGRVFVSADGGGLTLRLARGTERMTSVARTTSDSLAALGTSVTITYSGDSNYETSASVTVTLPIVELPSIVARPRDTTPPAIEIVSPGDGVRYARGEAVVASYFCDDPNDRSEVTECEGPIDEGSAVDTNTEGTFSFTVRAEDAFGNEASKTVTYEVGGQASAPAGSRPATGAVAPGVWVPAPTAAAPAIAAVRPQPGPPTRRTPTRQPAENVGAPEPSRPAAPASDTPKIADARPAPGAPARAQPAASPPRSKASPKRRVSQATRGSSSPVVARQGLAGYDPRSEPAKMIGILVAAFTLLQLCAGKRGLAAASGGGGTSAAGRRTGAGHQQASEPGFDFDYGGVDVEFLGAGLGAIALGDRSRTWGWPGTRALDALSAALPARLARRSPLLARVAADGTYLRAILGSGSLVGMLAGLALGFAAIQDTGGDALPPVAALTIAIAVLGVLDAAAGLVAVLTFTVGVLVLGGVNTAPDVRLMLGLGALWFVVPVLAGAARPLRRPPTRSLKESWDRAADFVIASLIGAWAVQKIVLALPGLAGMRLPIAEHANTAALFVLAALVVRLAAETIASHLYPRRLDISEANDLPEPGALQRLAASTLRTAIFLFFAQIVVGTSWQLWVGAALFVAPQILALAEERFPNSPRLYRALPKGLVELVLMLFVASAVGALLLSTMNENAQTFLANSFVALSLPGFLLSLLNLFGRDGDEQEIGWGKRFAGIAILVAAILLVLGLLL
ncbi:MAG TPA: hypothetical protein VF526_06610 [Solirubrobacteraceae bacterium]